MAGHVPAVSMLAGSAGAAGFDCCRVINILTSARAAGHIKVLENADTDAGTFLRARALAHEVFWRPVDAAGIGGVFECASVGSACSRRRRCGDDVLDRLES